MDNTVRKESKIIINNIIVYAIALLVANLCMQVYLCPAVTEWVLVNISKSNMLPYILFILIFVGVYILCSWLLKGGAVADVMASLTDKKALIFGWMLAAINGVLLIIGYLHEESLFDGPTAREYLFHMIDPVTVIFMCLVFALVVINIDRKKPQILLLDKGNGIVYILALFMALLIAVALFTPNSYKNFHGLYHTNAYFNSIYNYMHGEPRTELNGSVYGFYGMFLAPIVKLLGGTLTAYYVVIGLLVVVSYMCTTYAICNLIKSIWIKIITVTALAVYNLSFSYSIYRQLFPHRILFGTILVAYLVYICKNGRYKSSYGAIYRAIGYLICAVGIAWNFETGVVYTIAYTAFYVFQELREHSFKTLHLYAKLMKRVFMAAVTFFAAIAMVNLVNVCMGGDFVSIKMFLFPFFSDNYINGDLAIHYPVGVAAWLFVAALCFAVVGYAISTTKLVPEAIRMKGKENGEEKVGIVFVAGVMVLGQMMYYINRSAYGNLQIVYFLAILMIGVICECCLKRFFNLRKENTEPVLLKNFYKSFACIMATIMLVLTAGGILNYPCATVYRLYYGYKDMSKVRELEEELQSRCEKDTRALGYAVPLIYSEMGWDSYYHLLDIADIGLNEKVYEYLSNDLNNELDEPIIIEESTWEKMKDNISLDDFSNKFTQVHTFELYDIKLLYFVPN